VARSFELSDKPSGSDSKDLVNQSSYGRDSTG
jgi:hypothetical protein